MAPVLKRAADGRVAEAPLFGASEDFSFFAQEVPGLYVFLGITPRDQDPATAAPNHNPNLFVNETALVVGTRTLATRTVNFLICRAGVVPAVACYIDPPPPRPEIIPCAAKSIGLH
jgi:amidohydrolase